MPETCTGLKKTPRKSVAGPLPMRKAPIRNRILLTTTIFLLCAGLSGGCRSSERRAQRHYEEGLTQKSQHAYQEALRLFRQALDKNPGHIESHIELGILFSRQKEYRQALEHFKRAEALGAESYNLSALSGYAYEELGDFQQAEFYYDQALSQAPRLIDVRVRLANILEWQERHQEAAELLRQVLEFDPAFEQAEQIKRRVEILSRAKGPQLHLALADLYLRNGKHRRGAAEYRKADDFVPDDPEGLLRFGRFCLEREQFKLALDSFLKARQHGAAENFRFNADLALAWEKLGQAEAAIAEYRHALELAPEQALISLKIAELLEAEGQHFEAAAQLEHLFRLSLHTPQLQLGSAPLPGVNQLWEKILSLRGERSSKAVYYLDSPGQPPVVPVTVNQKAQGSMQVEPDMEYTVLSDRLTQSLGIHITSRTSEVRFNIYGRIESAALVTIRSLKVGELEARNIPILIGDLSRYPDIDGFLGSNFLKHFHMEINHEDHLFILTKLHS